MINLNDKSICILIVEVTGHQKAAKLFHLGFYYNNFLTYVIIIFESQVNKMQKGACKSNPKRHRSNLPRGAENNMELMQQ